MTFCKFLFLSILLFTSNTFSQEKAYVVDGDTIHIGSNKYRFSGIDTPEMKQTCSKDNKIIMCGMLAKDSLIQKINNRTVLCKEETIDRYKRIVAECFVNKESLSTYLVRNGYAFAYRKYSKKFIEDERYAKENKLGLWSMNFEYSWEYRRKLRSK